jgi:cobalt/nickel transport system permease protein
VIADETRRMRAALAARGYRPRHAIQAAAIGRVLTALFLRTFDRAERVYVAMLARGYGGTTPRLGALALRRVDVAFVAALVALLMPVRVLAGVTA